MDAPISIGSKAVVLAKNYESFLRKHLPKAPEETIQKMLTSIRGKERYKKTAVFKRPGNTLITVTEASAEERKEARRWPQTITISDEPEIDFDKMAAREVLEGEVAKAKTLGKKARVKAFLKKAIGERMAKKAEKAAKEAEEDKELTSALKKELLGNMAFNPFAPRGAPKKFKGLDMDDMLLIAKAQGQKLTDAQEDRVKELRKQQDEYAKTKAGAGAAVRAEGGITIADIPTGKKNAIIVTVKQIKQLFPERTRALSKYEDTQKARVYKMRKNYSFEIIDK